MADQLSITGASHAVAMVAAPAETGGEPALATARVIDVANGELRILCEETECTAARAFSCVIEPLAGDRVLTARVGPSLFVLAVLDRLVPDGAVLSAPGVSQLSLAAPRIAVEAGDTLDLSARTGIVVRSEAVNVRAGLFSVVGRLATYVLDRLKTTTRRQETVSEQLTVDTLARTTVVRNTDFSEVGTLVQKVEGVSATTAATAVLVAKEDLRFDGKRVSVG